MMSTTTKKILAFVLAISLLTGGFSLVGQLNESRRSLGLTMLELPAQARPDLLTSVLFSVGRALAVDYLWIGLQKMQEDGRYFDANQRSEWICQLQPHFTSVWIFQAWNMSYNISVAMTSGADRWRWVKNGYELLRDRGIPLNPKAIGMYQQLAWIFHHKIGAMSDDYHWYYKIQLARAMEDIIGWPDAKYDVIVKAPETWEKLVADPRMAEFVEKIREFKIDPQEKYLYLLSHRGEFGQKVIALLDNPGYAHEKDMLEGFLRADRLRREWKMDAKIIGELRKDDMYGPLDFRTPEAHAVYWSYAGFKAVGADTSFEALNTDRVIYGSLQELTRRGRFVITAEEMPLISPDIRFIPVLHRIYLSLGKKWAAAEKIPWDGTAGETFKDGHINYMKKAIGLYYQYGREDLAKKYWDMMLKLYPYAEKNDGLEAFVRRYVREDIKSMGLTDVNSTVVMFLGQAYQRYAMGDDYSALAMERWAKTIYDSYMQGQEGKNETGRMNMAPWKDLKNYAIKMSLQSLPENLRERLRTRLNLPPEKK
ncbi:MAG: hypothetical protein WC975_08280 [Phycisphaerae bacterium]